MKKGLIILATIVGVILLGNVIVAGAQGGPVASTWQMGPGMMGYTGTYTGTVPYGGMMGGFSHAPMHGLMMDENGVHEQVWTAIAQKLDMSYDELTAALQNGQTLAQIAESKGVSLDELQQVATDARTAALKELLDAGTITQEQYDWMVEHMDDMPMFGLGGFGPGNCPGWQPGYGGAAPQNPNGAPSNGFRGGPGGMMNGFRGGRNQPVPGGSNGAGGTNQPGGFQG